MTSHPVLLTPMQLPVVAPCALLADVRPTCLMRRLLWQQGLPVRVHQNSFAKYVSGVAINLMLLFDAVISLLQHAADMVITYLKLCLAFTAAGITTTLAWTLLNSGVALSEYTFAAQCWTLLHCSEGRQLFTNCLQ